MKELRALLLFAALLACAALALPFVAGAATATLVNDTFADGGSLNQALPNSVALFKSRSGTTRTDGAGSVTFDLTNAGGADGFWAFFTNTGSKASLAVGDRLSVSGTFSLTGYRSTSTAVRFGVLDSLGTRRTSDLTGGMSDSSFQGDTGYGLQLNTSGGSGAFNINRRTTFTASNIFSAGADFTAITTAASGNPTVQPLTDETPYTVTYTVERLTATETRISAELTGGALPGSYKRTVVETSTAPNTSFDYFAFRVTGADFATKIKFTRLLVDHTASQQEPPSNAAKVTLGDLTQTYTGAPLAPSVATDPAGLNVNLTYNGSAARPTAAGTYNVVATVEDAAYQGTATGTFVINPAPLVITLGQLKQTYDGTPKQVSATTTPPAAAPLLITYNGSAAPPVEPGRYSVVATVSDPNYQGSASATLFVSAPGAEPVRAFPGAEGAGELTPGGRGGDVYHVTNLNDSGPGSLREAVRTAAGPRTIVFDVSGTIHLNSRLVISKPFLTLAGQTAPGDGVTVAGWHTVISNTNNIIIRYMRFRAGDLNCSNGYEDDALTVDKSTDVIIDHVSASWSVDETLSVTESDRVTVQWSLITESLRDSCHAKNSHGYGSLIRYGSGVVTYHHNLYAHHDSRNPRLGDNVGLDFVNNVVYNWGNESGYSAEAVEGTPRLNFVGNYLVAGPSTPASKRRAFKGGSASTFIHQSDNLIDGNLNGARDGADIGWSMFTGAYTRQEPARFDFPPVATDDARTAYERVLNIAGHSLARDAADLRVISEVRGEGGRHIDSQNEVGGWPGLSSLAAPADADGDGIPDYWEVNRGLNPADAADGRAITASGYSNLELYLNDIVPAPGADKLGDDTPPTTRAALSRPANAAGWHNSDVTVTLAAADNGGGAGLHKIVYSVNGAITHSHVAPVAIPVTDEGITTITYYSKDDAGNAEVEQTLAVMLDRTAPSVEAARVTLANPAGWNNTDVAAGYTAGDDLSGLASPAAAGYTFKAEGAGQSYTFTVEDIAGNKASATVGGVNIDKTAPSINLAQPTEGGFYVLGQSATADYACGDSLSGKADCIGTLSSGAPLDTSSVGPRGFEVIATDVAGNTVAKAVTYAVGYRIGLLYDPAKSNKAGSTVPVKLQLFDSSGANLSSADRVVRALGTSPDNAQPHGPAADPGNANPGQTFRFDPTLGTTGGYIFNLKTTGYAPGTYRLHFTAGDEPHVYSVRFQIR
ncbi:MAG TPA: MBG domain-containing protein [Pyrinomonadaceae bacterium]